MIRAFLIAFALTVSSFAPAAAQLTDITCDDHERIEITMIRTLGAERRGMGLRDPDTVLELWVAPHSGEWTLLHSYANGTACIVAMGTHWEASILAPS